MGQRVKGFARHGEVTTPALVTSGLARGFVDLASIPVTVGSRYPAPFDEPCKTRRVQRLGSAAGLNHLGASRSPSRRLCLHSRPC